MESSSPNELDQRAEYWSFLACATALAALIALQRRPRKKKRPACGFDPEAVGISEGSDKTIRPILPRSEQTGRVQKAQAPWRISWRDWKEIVGRTYRRTGEDRLFAVAAGVVFYGLLALFPAITAAVSLYGLFANTSTLESHLSMAAGLVPSEFINIIREQITRLIAKDDTRLGFAFIFGFAVALWSANAGMKALIDVLNAVEGKREKRGFITLNLISLCFTVGAIFSLFFAVSSVVILPLAFNHLGLPGSSDAVFRYGRWPVLLFFVIAGLKIIYRFGPSQKSSHHRWISVGSLFASALWFICSGLLSWYLATYAHYDATYGSLGAAIGIMMWMWTSTIVVLLGAQLDSAIDQQTDAFSH